MKLYNAIKLGNAIEKYNKRFEEDMHLDFYEVVSLMLEPDEEVDDVIKEINKRLKMKRNAFELYVHDYINYETYRDIVCSL